MGPDIILSNQRRTQREGGLNRKENLAVISKKIALWVGIHKI